MPQVGSNALFNIKVFGSMGGEQTLNNFWYFSSRAPDSVPVGVVLDDFKANVQIAWSALVSDNWATTSVIGDEVTSIGNFGELPAGQGWVGTRLGTNDMPPYVCFDFRLFRTTKETRSGRKRVAGVLEADATFGTIEAGTITLMNDLASGFAAALPLGLGADAFPCIVRQTVDPITGAPLAPALWIYNLVSSVQSQPETTTQNTRKKGRGP